MNIVAFVSVKDDLDVIGPCLDNLLGLNFDHVVIVAVEPSKAMRQTVEAICARNERVGFHPLSAVDVKGSFLSFSEEPLATLIPRYQPDRLFVCDADEFLYTPCADIHDVAELLDEQSLSIGRYNFARQRGEKPDDIMAHMQNLAGAPLIYKRTHVEKDGILIKGQRWSEHTIWPKLVLVPKNVTRFGVGTHTVIGHGNEVLELRPSAELLLIHFPFTSFARFEAKVHNARAHMAAMGAVHNNPFSAWHWRTWIDALEQSRWALRDEFIREGYSEQEFTALTASGAIRTAGDALKSP